MIFNSLTYLLTIFVVTCLYWTLPKQPRLVMLCLANIVFYGFWRFDFILLIIFSVFIDYIIALKMIKKTQSYKKKLLILSIFINLSILFYFKYIIFFQENILGLTNHFGYNIDPIFTNIILPLGISFYTFQSISYIVDVYRNNFLPEKSILIYFCYVTFFPQLIAGPILRASEIVNQFLVRSEFNWLNILNGIKRILYGLFLKVVLADNIAPLVDEGYMTSIDQLFAIDVWTLSFLFGFQIYFDFSAYSHIAIGSAMLLGIYFPENFNHPYLSLSPREFWQKWHISLSSWIRDYLYLPLNGIRTLNKSTGGMDTKYVTKNTNVFLIITWSIMGLWHGANWNFLIWGIYHACIIIIFRLINKVNYNISVTKKHLIGIFITLPIIMIGWVPFRSDTVEQTFHMWTKIMNPYSYLNLGLRENTYLITFLILFGVLSFKIINNIKTKNQINSWKLNSQTFNNACIIIDTLKWVTITSLTFIFFEQANQFIYFQF